MATGTGAREGVALVLKKLPIIGIWDKGVEGVGPATLAAPEDVDGTVARASPTYCGGIRRGGAAEVDDALVDGVIRLNRPSPGATGTGAGGAIEKARAEFALGSGGAIIADLNGAAFWIYPGAMAVGGINRAGGTEAGRVEIPII